jgi:hypothetical protein
MIVTKVEIQKLIPRENTVARNHICIVLSCLCVQVANVGEFGRWALERRFEGQRYFRVKSKCKL